MIFITWLVAGIRVLGAENEFRALWADAFHQGFSNGKEVSKLVTDVRAANCNAVFVEVRRRGDACYSSQLEPKAPGIAPNYDPLADLVQKAHQTNGGPRIEVHAWIVAYPLWRIEEGVPAQTNHPFHLHPDWLSQNVRGATTDGREYHLDPGHPEVQKHIFNIAMDIISRYDVDGFNLDYLRYPGRDWGYNPQAVARFNQRFGKTGQPSVTDTNWTQFRRDQVTALMRKIYLSAIAVKPQLKISAATVAWPPVPKETSDWMNRSGAYGHLFQDWRGWMEEGILDINLPMVYLNHQQPSNKESFSQWVRFAANHRYNRHVVISPAGYLNEISGTLDQIRLARGSEGQPTDGVSLYSYASYSKGNVPRDTFNLALTKPGGYNKDAAPVFAEAVSTPDMPWKTKPTKGHLNGFVYGASKTNTLDGARIMISGKKNVTTTSDATGFYGAVDLPPGSYEVIASFPGHTPRTNACTISIGKVATTDVTVEN